MLFRSDLDGAGLDGTFDLVFAVDVLEHVDDLERTIAGIARVLAPGGGLGFLTHNRTIAGFLQVVWAEEYVQHTMPEGFHDFARFITPAELTEALARSAVGFLDGIEQWRVVGYAGVTPIVRAYVAAAIRLRGADRRPHTIAEDTDELAITRLDHLPAAVRAALEGTGVRVVEISADDAGQPARALPAARAEVQRVRAALERRLGEQRLTALGADEWLVVDGVLSDSPALSA